MIKVEDLNDKVRITLDHATAEDVWMTLNARLKSKEYGGSSKAKKKISKLIEKIVEYCET